MDLLAWHRLSVWHRHRQRSDENQEMIGNAEQVSPVEQSDWVSLVIESLCLRKIVLHLKSECPLWTFIVLGLSSIAASVQWENLRLRGHWSKRSQCFLWSAMERGP